MYSEGVKREISDHESRAVSALSIAKAKRWWGWGDLEKTHNRIKGKR